MRTAPLIVSLVLATALPAATAAAECSANPRHALLLHGGFMEYEEEVGEAHKALLARLLAEGNAHLAAGGSALDAVVNAIAALEDSGLLDAGKGSIVNTDGFTETDASLMDGRDGRSGAVAAMQRIKNPIRAARLVMEKTRHVLFAGATGEGTLAKLGAETIDPASYYQEYVPPPRPAAAPEKKHGTVGAAALDRCGHLAAGTSTGGWAGKLPGRIGDSPIIGASTFANQRVALSSTGVGEFFIKRAATRDIAMRVEYLRQPLREAVDYVVKDLIGAEDHARGAVIALDVDGQMVVSSNGYGVFWGAVSHDSAPRVGTREPPAAPLPRPAT